MSRIYLGQNLKPSKPRLHASQNGNLQFLLNAIEKTQPINQRTITGAGDLRCNPSSFIDADDAERRSVHAVSASAAVNQLSPDWKRRPSSASVVSTIWNNWRLLTPLSAATRPGRHFCINN